MVWQLFSNSEKLWMIAQPRPCQPVSCSLTEIAHLPKPPTLFLPNSHPSPLVLCHNRWLSQEARVANKLPKILLRNLLFIRTLFSRKWDNGLLLLTNKIDMKEWIQMLHQLSIAYIYIVGHTLCRIWREEKKHAFKRTHRAAAQQPLW